MNTITLRALSAATVSALLTAAALVAVSKAQMPDQRQVMLSAIAPAEPANATPAPAIILAPAPAAAVEPAILPASVEPAPAAAAAPAHRTARADKPKPRTLQMTVTAYCPCKKCCGENAQGITASGATAKANHSRFVAADTSRLAFRTRLSIPGYDGGRPVPILDRGGAIKGNRLDVFFPTHREALRWGVRKLTVTVLED